MLKNDSGGGVIPLEEIVNSKTVLQHLEDMHPTASEGLTNLKLTDPMDRCAKHHSIRFFSMDHEHIIKAARRTHGSAGTRS
ncbi:hypothetical protein GJ496_002404 [Pomphorhynchus laevis]|nr:hypothetical protein GJ496_002404 [Pomphorhynchus laevis]